MQASPLVRMRLFLGKRQCRVSPSRKQVTWAGQASLNGASKARPLEFNARSTTSRPQHSMRRQLERIATLRRAALLSTSKQSNSIRLAPAMRQIDSASGTSVRYSRLSSSR
ncbi:hypothetical protein NMC42_27910 [Pseudomonas aeruginosa]